MLPRSHGDGHGALHNDGVTMPARDLDFQIQKVPFVVVAIVVISLSVIGLRERLAQIAEPEQAK
ncbi:hypothetical protein, partial [Sulfobacillus harzensis]|uniref:hypothetical protein n=1 Tax=Sulfobacillus harzensis TaxID=2729629 RepID=UPI001A9BF50D